MKYIVNLYGGYCGMVEADSLEEANKIARIDQGRSNVESVKLASEEELKWTEAMGGPVPELDPVRPSEWARKGYYVIEGWEPKIGADCDYYDHDGIKRHGTIAHYDGQEIIIAGERTVIVEETFKIRHGR